MSYINPEGLIIPAGSDQYNLTTDLRTMGGSIRSVVPVADTGAGDTVATAMGTDGRAVTDTNPLIVFNAATRQLEVKSAVGWTGNVSASVSAGATQSIPTSAWTIVTYTSIDYETHDSMTTISDTTDQIVVPFAGIYLITYGAGIGGLVNDGQGIRASINGVALAGSTVLGNSSANGGSLAAAATIKAAANDIIRMECWHNDGASKTASGARLSVTRIGG